jgi:peptidoglycan hydrolase-like protein with peptidoglycan-binding domain
LSGGGGGNSTAQSHVMSRGQIEMAQWGLRRRGVNVPADGNLDRGTQRALAQFQRDNGLPVTGLPDPGTLSALQAARRLGSAAR